jgi:sulfate permease, SulP family
MPSWFFTSLRGYRIAWLPRDLVAGLMLLAIALPGQLATARLAGMPPETGIYAFVAGSLAFAAFGANRFMSVAADSTIAPIFAGGLAAIVGTLSARLPGLALPALPDMGELGRTIQLALVVAMVCIMQTSAVASTFPSDEGKPDDISRNFVGVGSGSILAGVIGAFAVDASPPSTAIVKESGGRSQFASLTAAALMVALAALAAGLTAYVPHAALSGVLVYIALRIFGVDEMVRIYRRSRFEILLVAASAGLVIALPIETGMLLAIVLSFVHSLYIIARPYCVELARVPGSTVWWPPTANG